MNEIIIIKHYKKQNNYPNKSLMKRRNSRNRKYYNQTENNSIKNQRIKGEKKKRNDINSNFERQEIFYSERNEDGKKIIKNILDDNFLMNNDDINSIHSKRKPGRKNKKIINNKMALEDDIYSVRSERNLRKKCEPGVDLINSLTIEIERPNNFKNNKRRNNRKQSKINNNNNNILNLKNDLKEEKTRKGKIQKNFINDINEEFHYIPIKEEQIRKRTTRSLITRNKNNKIENVKNPEKKKKNKSIKGNNKNKGKDKKKKEENEVNNIFNLNKNKKSRSYYPKSNQEKKEKKKLKEKEKEEEKENYKTNIIKRNRRDYSSPRNCYGNNRRNILNNELDEEKNYLKNYSSEKKINHKKFINNNITANTIYSHPIADYKNFTITVDKHLVIDIPKNNIRKDVLNEIHEVKMLGRKRKRAKNKKEKEPKNNKVPNKNKKSKNNDAKEKNDIKGKSHNLFKVEIKKEDNDNNSQISNEYDQLKNDLNCDRNKSIGLKGKQGTRRHKSLKKKDNQFDKCDKLNSLDSYSEPDKDINDCDCFNQGNNYNLKLPNYVNLSNEPIQIDNTQNNYSQNMNANFKSDPSPNNINNNNKNNLIHDNNNNEFRLISDSFNNNYVNIELISNSLNLNSETANFMGSSNNFEYSFPLDLEEKVDLKEDKTYYTKVSKYIKSSPIDKYLPTISNEKKKPYNTRIIASKTCQISFTKNKNKINQIDSDNEITDITSSNNEYNNYNTELPSILNLARIKPYREEHAKMIKDKLNQEGIKLYQSDGKNLQKYEIDNYLGSFALYDEKNNIKVTVPCYKINEKTKEFFHNKRLSIIEFQEDNDINTDEEQLELEVQRNNKAFQHFMNKVNKHKNYVDKNLFRKKKE